MTHKQLDATSVSVSMLQNAVRFSYAWHSQRAFSPLPVVGSQGPEHWNGRELLGAQVLPLQTQRLGAPG